MKLTILGCGGAGGVPSISGGWGECDPGEPRNRRRRTSALVESGAATILIDTSPDLREQLLDVGVRRLDAVLYTHAHADHLHGIDDLREINRLMQAPLPVYATADVLDTVRRRFGYVFERLEVEYYYKPVLQPTEIVGHFNVGDVTVQPFVQDHGTCTSLGFRIGEAAYSTDLVGLDDEAFATLAGVRVWVVDAFVDRPHDTHANVELALSWIDRLKPERAVLTHMGPGLDYNALRQRLPRHVEPAYDGMVIEV